MPLLQGTEAGHSVKRKDWHKYYEKYYISLCPLMISGLGVWKILCKILCYIFIGLHGIINVSNASSKCTNAYLDHIHLVSCGCDNPCARIGNTQCKSLCVILQRLCILFGRCQSPNYRMAFWLQLWSFSRKHLKQQPWGVNTLTRADQSRLEPD